MSPFYKTDFERHEDNGEVGLKRLKSIQGDQGEQYLLIQKHRTNTIIILKWFQSFT